MHSSDLAHQTIHMCLLSTTGFLERLVVADQSFKFMDISSMPRAGCLLCQLRLLNLFNFHKTQFWQYNDYRALGLSHNKGELFHLSHCISYLLSCRRFMQNYFCKLLRLYMFPESSLVLTVRQLFTVQQSVLLDWTFQFVFLSVGHCNSDLQDSQPNGSLQVFNMYNKRDNALEFSSHIYFSSQFQWFEELNSTTP